MHQGIILGLLGEILEHFRLHGHRDARLHGGGGGGQLEFDGDSLCCATHAKREAMHVITDHKVGAWEDNVHDDLTKWRVSYKCQIINFFNLRPSLQLQSPQKLYYCITTLTGLANEFRLLWFRLQCESRQPRVPSTAGQAR